MHANHEGNQGVEILGTAQLLKTTAIILRNQITAIIVVTNLGAL